MMINRRLKNIITTNLLFSKNIKNFSASVEYKLISTNNDIGLITIKNSAKRNALSYDILNNLINELDKIEKNFENERYPRVVILNSEGGVFSSGHDLKELEKSPEELRRKIFYLASELMIKIQKSPSIIIAEVQGLATAAGCQLAATCDLIVASQKAKFETPGVRIGLFCSTPSVALARAISTKRAMHMLVTGEQIDAKKGLDWGLVNEVVEVDLNQSEEEQRRQLRERSLILAEQISQYSAQALSFGKKTFYDQLSMGKIESAYEVAGEAMCANLCFEDTKEGINAFLQKRKPTFNKKL